MKKEAEDALDAFDREFGNDCAREGWILSETSDDTIQCQRIDSPDDEAFDGLKITPLASDEAAWALVMAGTMPHHITARSILEQYSPEEYSLMMGNFCEIIDKELK